MAHHQSTLPNLRPPSIIVNFDGFVAVLTVDEGEVEITVFETASCFHRRQANQVQAAGIDGEMPQRIRRTAT